MNLAYQTQLGEFYHAKIEEAFESERFADLRGRVNLIFFSPPFPLNRKKKYRNLQGEEYIAWLSNLAPPFRELLAPAGSIVAEVGNSWEPGDPVMSTLA